MVSIRNNMRVQSRLVSSGRIWLNSHPRTGLMLPSLSFCAFTVVFESRVQVVCQGAGFVACLLPGAYRAPRTSLTAVASNFEITK